MRKTKNTYKNKGGASINQRADASRSIKVNTLPQTSISNAFHMLGMIMPLLTTMTLFIIFMVNAKWIALTF